ncbi:hypothetical protein BsWGS_23737 [Bradybaena similaris]
MKTLDVHKQNMLFHLIEQGAHKRALKLLKRENHFTEDELNKSLISACHHGYSTIVQTLVQLGANVNDRDTNGNTPLLISVQTGLADVVEFLLTNKADVNASNFVGDSALIVSIRSSESTKITEALLKQPGINIDHKNQDGYTAIMTAAEVRNVYTLKALLDKYPNVDCKTISALRYTHIDECKIHEHTSDSVSDYVSQWTTLEKTVNSKGENVYQIAERCGIGGVVKLLQEHVCTKISPLELAVKANDIKSFHIILDCNFLHTPEMKTSFDKAFIQIFQKCSDKDMTYFSENDITMMKTLLKHGADVSKTLFDYTVFKEQAASFRFDQLRSTPASLLRLLYGKRQIDPIIVAARSGCVQVLELLLSHKADVNRYDFHNSPLHIALSHGHSDCAKLLIQHGAKMNLKHALKLAVDQQEPNYVRFLIENYKNKIRKCLEETFGIQSILFRSVRKGSLDIIGQILHLGANINDVLSSGTCPLAESKNGEVAKFLIDRGAIIKQAKCLKRIKSQTPLIMVLINRDSADNSVIEVVQVLLENGASADDRCWNGRTTLILAAMREGSMSMMQLLLSHGADLNERDNLGNSALIYAVCKGCFQNVSFLLQIIKHRKQFLNLQNSEGLTALVYAVRLGNPMLVQELVDQGADINIKDKLGNTFLLRQLISEEHNDKTLRSLIQAGCDVNSQNNDGLSPLMVAARSYLLDTMCVLLDLGAEINAVSKKDSMKTALTHLIYKSYLRDDYFDCLKLLLDRGASASYLAATTLHKMIMAGDTYLIPQLIQCGLGPASVLVNDMLRNLLTEVRVRAFHCSPLFTALCVGNSALGRFFVGNLFLTHYDVSWLGSNELVRQHLARKKYKGCLVILKEISTRPMALFNLSFVAVSTAIGAAPGREIRVNKLPVPQVIKDKLLFKKLDATLTWH